MSASEIKVGDQVFVRPKGAKKGIAQADYLLDLPEMYTPVPRTYGIFVFTDPDVAQRAAKALIHAIVLCHKDEAPSLF